MPDAIAKKIADFIANAKALAADGLTWAEFGEILIGFLRLAIHAYDGVIAMTGVEKKAAVLEAVGTLFDALADYAVPTVLLPVWFIVRPAVRSLVIALASGAIETLLPLVRK